ncbi:amidase family protein [Streptomyces sp. NBC_00989]|uniref:amidase family protein n=1 Tax=Streptomyces sp. NBC_00989 TaxID=2903705 RepID=UPI00386EBBF9|nr:amidase family protein [Streptomyces sp. NBC_00989]
MGIPCYTDTAVVGRPAVTPYDTSRYASGSSGGAAAVVAAGLIPVGHGTDGAGSVRTPSAVCGPVGVKPSTGLVGTAPESSFLGFVTADHWPARSRTRRCCWTRWPTAPPTGIYGAPHTGSFLDAAVRPP